MRAVVATLFLFLVSALLKANASVEQITGFFECQIKQQVLMFVNDGEHLEYSGYTGYANVDDRFTLTYEFAFYGYNRISVKAESLSDREFKFSMYAADLQSVGSDLIRSDAATIRDDTVVLKDDYIYLEDTFGTLVRMERHAEDTWSGVLTDVRAAEVGTLVSTFDCRHRENSFDDIRQLLRQPG